MAAFHGLGRSPERRCMPLGEWPKRDRELWLAATREGDIFDGCGRRSHFRAASNRKMEQGYGRFLTFLQRRGLLQSECATSVIDGPLVVAYVEELRAFGNTTATILGRLQEIHDLLVAIRPELDWSVIRRISSWVRRTQTRSDHKRHKMVGAEELLDLGIALMRSADQMNTARMAAMTFRDGLLIGLLALRPLRLRNLTGLRLGLTLLEQRGKYQIVFESEGMKNGVPYEVCWPEVLISALEQWLQHHRPHLAALHSQWAREIGDALWVSSHGSPMTKQAIYDRIRARTAEAFGTAINPHLFRDIAATTQAIADPEHVRIAAPLLGHTNFATTEKYYLQARMLESTERYQNGIAGLRRELRNSRTTPATMRTDLDQM